MTLHEAMEQRVSRRCYTGPLPAAEAAWLAGRVEETNAEYGLSFSLVPDDAALFGGFLSSYGVFSGVRSMVVVAGPEADPHLHEKAGHAGQQLVLELTARGMGSCWVCGSFDRRAAKARLAPGETLVGMIVCDPVRTRQNTRERLVRRVIHLSGQSQIWRAVGTPPPWFLAGVHAAALAPSTMNTMPSRFLYNHGQAVVRSPDQNLLQRVDLGIAKLHFELGAKGRFPLGNPAQFTPGDA